MRPTRLALPLAALLLLAPASAFAGKGGGGGGGNGSFPAGDYFFFDKVSGDKIKSIATIDQAFNEFCLTGLALFIDTAATLNKRVEFEFLSLGTIDKESSDAVNGVFTSVDLRLTVYNGPETTDAILFDNTVSGAPCELRGKLSKAGDQLKATLACELGPNLAVKGVIPGNVLDSIAFALDKKKSIKIDIDSGRFRINHNGVGVDPVADQLDFSALDCPTSSDEID